LSKKLAQVLDDSEVNVATSAASMDEEDTYVAPTPPSKPAPQPKAAAPAGDDDDMMSYFQNLAQNS